MGFFNRGKWSDPKCRTKLSVFTNDPIRKPYQHTCSAMSCALNQSGARSAVRGGMIERLWLQSSESATLAISFLLWLACFLPRVGTEGSALASKRCGAQATSCTTCTCRAFSPYCVRNKRYRTLFLVGTYRTPLMCVVNGCWPKHAHAVVHVRITCMYVLTVHVIVLHVVHVHTYRYRYGYWQWEDV